MTCAIMTSFLALKARLYAALLPLYPPDSRRDFGAEMAAVFAEDLSDAWRDAGLSGAIRVWLLAAIEFVRIALPGLMQIPAIAVPLLAFLFSTVFIGCALLFGPRSFEAGAAMGTAFINPVTHSSQCAPRNPACPSHWS